MIIWHQLILCTAFQHFLSRKHPIFKGIQINFSKLGYHEGSFFLEDVSLSHSSLTPSKVKIQKLLWKPKVAKKNTEPLYLFELWQPQIDVDISKNSSDSVDINLYDLFLSLDYLSSVAIYEGKVNLTSHNEQKSLFFSYTPEHSKEKFGAIDVFLSASHKHQPQLICEVNKDQDLLEVNLLLSPTQISSFKDFIPAELGLESGEFFGKFTCAINKEGKFVRAYHHLEAKELRQVSNEKIHLFFELITLEGGFEASDGLDPHGVSYAKSLDYLKPHLSIKGAELLYLQQDAFISLIQNFSSDLVFDQNGKIVGSFMGDIDHQIPFGFEGEGYLHSFEEWSLEMKAKQPFVNLAHFKTFSIHKHVNNPLALELYLEKLECKKLSDFQKKIPLLFSLPLDFEQGVLSGQCLFLFDKTDVKKIIFQNLDLKDVVFNYQAAELKGKISRLEAQGSLPLPFSAFSPTNFCLKFEDVLFDQKSLDLSQITLSGQIRYEDFSFSDSSILFKGAAGQLESILTGSLDDIHAFFHLNLNKDHPYAYIQQALLKRGASISALLGIEGEICWKTKEDHIEACSKLELFFDQFSDVLEVDARFNPYYRFEKALFRSEKVSPSTYLWFMEYYHQKWYVLGDMQVRGEITPDMLCFDIQTTQAFFDSEDITVFIDQQLAVHQGHFLFDFSSRKWKIDLPIQQARCIDKKLHLPFENVTTQVTIEGTIISAKKLKASCEGVNFEGKVIVDFSEKQWNDLKLFPHKMEGDSRQFLQFLSYIPGFENCIKLPASRGWIQGSAQNYFFIRYNDDFAHKQAHIQLNVSDVSLDLSTYCPIEKIDFGLLWDPSKNFLEIKDFKAVGSLDDEEIFLKAPILCCKNLSTDEWDFDVRLENKTHDLVRLTGGTTREGQDLRVDFDPHLNQCFGGNVEIVQCLLDPSGKIKRAKGFYEISVIQLFKMLQISNRMGFSFLKSEQLESFSSLKKEGSLSFDLDYAQQTEEWIVKCKGENILFDTYSCAEFEALIVKTPSSLCLKTLKSPFGSLRANLITHPDQPWTLDYLEAAYKNSMIKLEKGILDKDTLLLSVQNSSIDLGDLPEWTRKNKYLEPWCSGIIHVHGLIQVEKASSWMQSRCLIQGSLYAEEFSQAALSLGTPSTFQAQFTMQNGLQLQAVNLDIQDRVEKNHKCLCFIKNIEFGKEIIVQGLEVAISPEMLVYMTSHQLVSPLSYKEGYFSVGNSTFRWDNQVECICDLSFGSEGLYLQVKMKEGYYWIEEHSLWIDHFFLTYDRGNLSALFGLDHLGLSLDLFFNYNPNEEGVYYLTLKERNLDEEQTPLQVICRYLDQEGFFIQSMEGKILGLDMSLRKNSRAYAHDKMMLTGQIKIDTHYVFHSLRQILGDKLSSIEIGSGYELSGDWILDKNDLLLSSFQGFLKGRDLELLGYEFKTLLSHIEITSTSIEIQDFCLSDLSGVLKIQHLKIIKQKESMWNVLIPDLLIQDFRPSRLKKQESNEEKLKPFIIKELHFSMIEGTLGQLATFRGKGRMDFVNTFKTEMNIFDIPIEILGRIGFDPGMFVPVIGKLEFEMKEGKIFLKELKNTYSEGKRSKFYLSGYKDSYIGLDGHIFIDIKMKQYVLLKITEPFTLSVRGTLSKPKYSLR